MKIELYGQPIMTASKKIAGSEILFRMGTCDGEVDFSPENYLQAMHDRSMPWFMDATVIGLLMTCDTSIIDGTLFLNVCSETLSSTSLFDAWLKGVRELSVRRGPGRLAIEIPEQGMVSLSKLKDRLHDIRDTGAKLALDDYPGGNLTDEYLTLYHWDYIKICLAQCHASKKPASEVIRSIKKARPATTIIAERLPRDHMQWAVEAGVNGFQSFDLGKPQPLNMDPFHNPFPVRNELVAQPFPLQLACPAQAHREMSK